MKSDELDAVFAALASAPRRRILDILKASPGCNVQHVAAFFDVSRIQVLKHLRVLEAASLVVSRKEGRERRLYFNPVPIQLIHDRWTTEFSAHWAARLTALKFHVEGTPEPEEPAS